MEELLRNLAELFDGAIQQDRRGDSVDSKGYAREVLHIVAEAGWEPPSQADYIHELLVELSET